MRCYAEESLCFEAVVPQRKVDKVGEREDWTNRWAKEGMEEDLFTASRHRPRCR